MIWLWQSMKRGFIACSRFVKVIVPIHGSIRPTCAEVGAKGWGLIEMASLGLPVPEGFIIPAFFFQERDWKEHVMKALEILQTQCSQKLGEAKNPLFLSVRSSGVVSMPGMMDTFLNVGLGDNTQEALFQRLGHRDVKHNIPCAGALEQLWYAIEKVKNSSQNERAQAYRGHHGITEVQNPAVVVQRMVFGNARAPSGTGVVFSRNPNTGHRALFGEYLERAQGEDLVSGEVTPYTLDVLQEKHPALYQELESYVLRLDQYFCDMQDVEFSIEEGKLWLLQTRSGKRSAVAHCFMLYDDVQRGTRAIPEALMQLNPASMSRMMYPQLLNERDLEHVASGSAACAHSFTGIVTFRREAVTDQHIFVCAETHPEDMEFMMRAGGVVTFCGGLTSHAAVVLRGLNKPCIVGVENGAAALREGDWITLDGAGGHILRGKGVFQTAHFPREAEVLLAWADEAHSMVIRANADNPNDLRDAQRWGANGVGLCRSEHMMLQPERLALLQRSILAKSLSERQEILQDLYRLHAQDFYELLRVSQGQLFTVRLLDPPLHEFLPYGLKEQEINPMLGHRGCRLGITHPEIYEMQVRALFRGAQLCQEEGISTQIAIMVPLITHVQELLILKELVHCHSQGQYRFGMMVETPRAALLAECFAPHVDFMSFGTNDLTQTFWALSRDDASKFLPIYQSRGIADPFKHFDAEGLGTLMRMAIEKVRKTNARIKISVCGEHAGYPESTALFQNMGVDELSCVASAIPGVRLAAAQAALA